MAASRILLKVFGHEYDIPRLVAIAKTSPDIEVEVSDIHPNTGDLEVILDRDQSTVLNNNIIVTRHEGGYVVLFGRHLIPANAGKVKAKLISKPALKRCKEVEEDDSQPYYQPPASFPERPRTSSFSSRDERPRSQYGKHLSHGYPRSGGNRGGSSS